MVSEPAITSECPFRYLVAACMTRSAPRASGWVSTGVATVELTASRAPARCAISATAAMSLISHKGLAGVSSQIRRVRPGCTAAATAARSVVSTSSTARPQRTAWSNSQPRSAQYITRGTTTWSPGDSAWNTAVAAAMPEANRSVAAPPSSSDSRFSARS